MNTYNLIYHLSLTHVNPILYFNIFNLKKYIKKFNGKKIININYLDKAFAEDFIAKTFNEYKDIKFYFTNNNETNQMYELVPFMDKLLPSVYSLDKDEYTFYGHAKGVTRYNSSTEFISLLWAHTMYSKNLDDFEYISKILKDYSCCGTLKIDKAYTALWFVPWHYSGAFFWFKNEKIFSKNWKKFHPTIHGLEGYLGFHIPSSEAFSIPPNLKDGQEDVYDKKKWELFYNV